MRWPFKIRPRRVFGVPPKSRGAGCCVAPRLLNDRALGCQRKIRICVDIRYAVFGPRSRGVTAFIPIYPNKLPTVPKPSRASQTASLVFSNLPTSQSAITRLLNRFGGQNLQRGFESPPLRQKFKWLKIQTFFSTVFRVTHSWNFPRQLLLLCLSNFNW